MVVLEIALLVIGVLAVISAIDFIAKTTSNITHSFGIPEYLASTIVLTFIVVLPILLIMIISNFYDAPALGLSTAMGFATAVLTLIMGIFLIRNEVPVEHEGSRGATFMWASALLLLIVSFDKFIDRMDAIFLLLLFLFYVIYVVYRSGKSKEYVYLKKMKFNWWIYPISLVAILICSWFVVFSALNLRNIFSLPLIIFGGVFLGLVFALPLFDIIFSIFRSSKLTFDNLLGTVIVCLTLVPGIAAVISPIPLTLGGNMTLIPFITLNMIAISFALITRLTYKIHKKTGIILLIFYAWYVMHMFFV